MTVSLLLWYTILDISPKLLHLSWQQASYATFWAPHIISGSGAPICLNPQTAEETSRDCARAHSISKIQVHICEIVPTVQAYSYVISSAKCEQ